MELIKDLPEVFEEFAEQRQKSFLAVKELKEKGVPVVGSYCTYFPKEIAMAMGAGCVSLCSTSDETIPEAEKDLPKNLCPLIKSSYGFAKTDKCPFFYFSDVVVGTENQGEAILPDIAQAVKAKMAEKDLVKEQIIGLGMGLPAPVNEDGIVQNTANLGWGYKEVTRELEELLDGMKVIPGNDANVAALGEMWKGGGKGHKNVIMVTLGTGVGGGIIVDGKCLVGAHGAGGEIGHLCVNYQETETCGCGKKGCLEQYASATGITRLANMRLAKDEKPSTLRNVAEMSAKEVFDAVKAGDEVAIEIATEFGKYLGHALANLAAACDPAVIVIGGGVSKAGEVLLDYIKGPFKEMAFFADKDTEFALAELANDAGICGAAKLVLK